MLAEGDAEEMKIIYAGYSITFSIAHSFIHLSSHIEFIFMEINDLAIPFTTSFSLSKLSKIACECAVWADGRNEIATSD